MIPADGRIAVALLLGGIALGTWELVRPRRIWPGVSGAALLALALENFQRQARLWTVLAVLVLPTMVILGWTWHVRQQKRNRL